MRIRVFNYTGKYAVSEDHGLAINAIVKDQSSFVLDFDGVSVITSNFWSGLLGTELRVWYPAVQFYNINPLMLMNFFQVIEYLVFKEGKNRHYEFRLSSERRSGTIEIGEVNN